MQRPALRNAPTFSNVKTSRVSISYVSHDILYLTCPRYSESRCCIFTHCGHMEHHIHNMIPQKQCDLVGLPSRDIQCHKAKRQRYHKAILSLPYHTPHNFVRLSSRDIKLIAFELAAKFSRRRENPVQPRLYNAENAICKRLKTGFSLRSRSSPANSNATSFIDATKRETY
jgi:hypothetical protein